jgi:hypothetical protein
MYLDGIGGLELPPPEPAFSELLAATVGSVGTVQKSLPL